MALLREVITLAGLALQAEDCGLRAAGHSRQEFGGLTRLQNERYYQFIVWRSALPKWRAEVERDTHDMILHVGGEKYIFEMKHWRENTDFGWKKIQQAIDKLKNKRVRNGYVMVFSGNPPAVTDENFSVLKGHLTGIDWPGVDYRFSTQDCSGSPFEFWLVAWACSQ